MNANQLTELKAELRQLPKSSTPLFPYGERRQLVVDLLEEIQFLREQDYSFSLISDLLQEKTGISFTPKTLRRYFFEELAKQGDSPKSPKQARPSFKSPAQKTRKPGSARKRASQPQAAEVPVTAAEAEPASEAQTEPKPASAEINAPGITAREPEVWNDDWDDDDSMTGGLLNEPTFNTIRRN